MKDPFFVIILICICACFYFLGYIFYFNFLSHFLPEIDGVKFNVQESELVYIHNSFGFVCALLPLSVYLTWQAIPLFSVHKKTLSFLIIYICISLSIFLRYKMLTNELSTLVQSLNSVGTVITFQFTALHYEFYIGGGILLGCIISYLAFHNKVVQRKYWIN